MYVYIIFVLATILINIGALRADTGPSFAMDKHGQNDMFVKSIKKIKQLAQVTNRDMIRLCVARCYDEYKACYSRRGSHCGENYTHCKSMCNYK